MPSSNDYQRGRKDYQDGKPKPDGFDTEEHDIGYLDAEIEDNGPADVFWSELDSEF